MAEIAFEALNPGSFERVERSWTRAYAVTGLEPMLSQRAKHKMFQPTRLTIEFYRIDEHEPVLPKAVLHGPFVNAEGSGMRVFSGAEFYASNEVADELREMVYDVMACTAGQPVRMSIFAKMARRAEGWDTEPFSPDEERLWAAYEDMNLTPTKRSK